ncbi:spondin domain-containing protein [Aestuariivivens insulae]|uniref:spondin domain-containing protein n=1 Tax=Aestuariivivens insulae TaxID=1621988 RepID=UPI001F5A2E5A|nr:spondin domain-containing protein [Aestuariivivens insulae]
MLRVIFILPLLCLYSIVYGQSTAIYDVTFTSIWNATDHTSIPNNAHWSDLVGATHNTANEFLELGQLASDGIKNVAELGSNTNFQNEVNNAIDSYRANQWLQQSFSLHAAISSATLTNVQVNESYPLLTLVSMVAPSPDWFIAINSLNLRTEDNTNWKPSFSMDVYAYDAGTDDGIDYTSDNIASNPPVGIYKINGTPFNGNVIGSLTVTLQSVLNVDKSNFETLSIYPNPTHGEIVISNPKKIQLKTIEVYNVLGELIKCIKATQPINLYQSPKGIYFVRLKADNDQHKTLKLVLQ